MRHRRKHVIHIVERKLQRECGGRGKLFGQSWRESNLIEIDPRQSPKSYLDTVIHELLHLAVPSMSESRVLRTANLLSRSLWRWGYRRVSQ